MSELEPHERAVVLFSGGQDSTTCLYWALERFESVTALFIHYGQRHGVEVEQARQIAHLAKVELIEQQLDLSRLWAANSLTDESLPLGSPAQANESLGLPSTFVPGRNLLFLTLAAILARRVEAQHIVGGMCQTDYAGYPDCRRDFIDATEQALRLGFRFDFLIHTPLMFLDKAQIWLLADQLDCLDVVRDLSHTCYAGDRTTLHAWGYGCGNCKACYFRSKGWTEAFGAT